MQKKATIVIFIFFIHLQMQAQSPAFYHLSTAEGLSDNNVTMAARDRNGILWIATSEGLNSFDGNRITAYHKYKYPQLADNNIERIVIDDNNRIWLRTNTHYITMLDEKRKFHRILVGDTSDKNTINALNYNSSQGVFAVKGRQHYFQKKNSIGVFEKKDTPFDSLLSGPIAFSYNLDGDKLLYYKKNKLIIIDYATMKVLLQFLLPGIAGAQYINKDELIAFTTKGNIFYRISITQQKVIKEYRDIRDQHNLPITGNLRNLTRIDENRFAFTTYFSGLYILDLQKETALHLEHDPIDQRSIGGNNTFNIRYDTSGYLFVTTQTSGLHFFNLKQQQATSKPYFIDDKKQIFDGFIQSIVTDDESNVWMGAQDRLIKWNRLSDKTVYVPCLLPNGTNITGQETIRVVNWDESGNLWVGTTRNGILILNKQSKTIAHITDSIPGRRTGFPSSWINAICTDKNGNRWVGTLRGTCIIKKNTLEIINLKGHPVLAEMSKVPCNSLFSDNKGRMWIGTTGGAWCYDEEKNNLIHYSISNGLIQNSVQAINEDDWGNYYFATAGGLTVLSKDKKIKSYNRVNGLQNDRCNGLQKDEKGFIWVGNLNNILRYDPVNKKFTVFQEGVGFNHAGYRIRCSHQNNTGDFFWGSDKGLVFFKPAEMSGASAMLYPSINSLQTTDSIFRFTGKESLEFPYKTSSFLFNFSSGDLTGGKNIQFSYRLTGFDKRWIIPSANGQASYSKLPPGNFQFEIRASNDGITWHNCPYAVFITIGKPWWQQTWFRSLMVTLAVLLFFLIYRYIKKRKKAKEIQQMINYFANSGYEHSSVNDILWDISRNCVSRLRFEDCVIYLIDEEQKMLVQKAAYGPKNPRAFEIKDPIEIPLGKGIAGDVAITGKACIVNNTSKDSRYLVDDEKRLSEITVPITHDGKVLGIIDSENRKANFFKQEHLKALQTIASLCAAKISRAMALDAMKKSKLEVLELNVKMAESRFSNLRLQMNPHFLFNSLSSIQHLIISQQTTKAYKYLTLFSNFLRTLLNFAEKNFIPLDEELKILTMYVELESLRFDESFTYEIIIDENLANELVVVPSLMVQPFAENAIWHGLLHKEGEKKLTIRFSNETDEFLTCTIEDNGAGRTKSAATQQNKISSLVHQSKGISIIKERLSLLQQKTGKPAHVEIIDLYSSTNEPAGTRVIITIPFYNPEEI